MTARQKAQNQKPMMTRTATASVTGRASSMRRLRRRSSQARANRLFCGTNGCASFLDLNTEAGVATCHICGYTRRLH